MERGVPAVAFQCICGSWRPMFSGWRGHHFGLRAGQTSSHKELAVTRATIPDFASTLGEGLVGAQGEPQATRQGCCLGGRWFRHLDTRTPDDRCLAAWVMRSSVLCAHTEHLITGA
jgi:hypothetical protein